jgi:CheY-like chemotaxis protein
LHLEPDLISLDHSLPDGSGDDFLTEIKANSPDSLVVIVKEVDKQDITYKKIGFSISNPDYKISLSSVSYIAYFNGTKDFFSDSSATASMDSLITKYQDFYLMGYNDAIKNYKGYKSAATLTFLASLYSPIIGLVPAIVCSAKPPEYQSLSLSNFASLNNVDYRNGYIHKAKRIKQQKVWKNWLIPTSIWATAITGFFVLLNN